MSSISFRKKASDSFEAFIIAFMMAYMSPLAAGILFFVNADVIESMKEYYALVGFMYIGSIEIWLNPENIEKMAGGRF